MNEEVAKAAERIPADAQLLVIVFAYADGQLAALPYADDYQALGTLVKQVADVLIAKGVVAANLKKH